jgi:hypothetical protein
MLLILPAVLSGSLIEFSHLARILSYDTHNGTFMKSIIALILSVYFFVVAFAPLTDRATIASTEYYIYLPIVNKSEPFRLNVVVNGDFEAGRTDWIEYEDSPYFNFPLIVHENDLSSPIKPFNGSWVAWLGGDSELITYIEQQVTIPESSPELVYWHWVDSRFDCDDSFGGVVINETYVDYYLLCSDTDTGGWVKRTVDLNAFAGQTVVLWVFSRTEVDNYSSLYIDAVSIHASP